ncbi:restriction endonuclease subunit S [Bacillus wiedmannii]
MSNYKNLWYGETPFGWVTTKIKHYMQVRNGKEVFSEIEQDDNAINVYGSGGVFKWTNESLYKGESVLFGRKGTIGKPLFINEEFWTVDTMYYTRFSKDAYPKYFYYLMVVFPWNNITTQTALPSVVGSDIENFSCSVPKYQIQKTIAEYLDCKISNIDDLIKHKENLISLLEEKRQIMITEAVTKGVNPNVKMKDSGVEWISEIPNGWNIAKLKYFSQRIGDGLHGTPIYDDNGEIYFINGNNLGLKEIRLTENTNKISLEEFMKYKQSIGPNTILISLNGTIGKLSIYNEETIMLSKSAGFINLKESINKEFVYYFLKSSIVKNFYEQSFAGTTINNLSLETLRNTPLLVPDIEVQKEIVSYLNNLEFNFEKILGELHLQTQKFKNFRQSLIYEAVTGKIDVRDFELKA